MRRVESTDLEAHVEKCLACAMARMGRKRPVRQGRTGLYSDRVTRRFQLVGMDVLKISPTRHEGNSKLLVFGEAPKRR